MPARVTLTVTKGKLLGKAFVFDERTTCLIGRATDCQLRLPAEHKIISRHHCLLDINPPDVRVRDFGSLNGTYVNGRKIGQRAGGMSRAQASQRLFPELDLKDGDEIELGKTVFQVSIFAPALCVECGVEVAEEGKVRSEKAPGVYVCQTCAQEPRPTMTSMHWEVRLRVCAQCGRDVSTEECSSRRGDYICNTCKTDPAQIVHALMQLAQEGDQKLLATRGYQIIKELGRGGMGAVYLARHGDSGRQVALKVMLPRMAANEQAKQMFLREMENTKILKHKNVVQLLDLGCARGTFFFTLEYCAGGCASQLLHERGGRMPIPEALRIALQAIDGLEYAHNVFEPGRGLIHRDIKPQNIFLAGSATDRNAKIGDYGLSKAFDLAGLSGHTCTGTIMGTPVFMPRQQIVNFKYARPEVDIWAMAATLYYLITGCAPRDFPPDKDPWQVLLQTSAVPIRKRDASIPKKLAAVIDRGLVDKPNILFQSAAEFKEALLETEPASRSGISRVTSQ